MKWDTHRHHRETKNAFLSGVAAVPLLNSERLSTDGRKNKKRTCLINAESKH